MGARTFRTKATGKTAAEAFKAARSQAQYDHGHAGYTGTIAEKGEFVMITVPLGVSPDDPEDYAQKLLEEGDSRVRDKWGPAGCIALGDGKWLFFGWASE